MQLYLWPSGPKPSGQPGPVPPGSDDYPGMSYENVKLQNKPISKGEEQVLYMNASDAQKQNNQAVSQMLANLWYSLNLHK